MTAKSCCTPQREAATAPSRPAAACAARAATAVHPLELVTLAGGQFTMGTDSLEGFPADGEGPARSVRVNPFAIAGTTVTNAQFSAFVRATGYVTQAEEAGSSFVFYLQVPPPLRATIRRHPHGLPWWLEVADACWQRPAGPGSGAHGHDDEPVVHVSWNDAQAYCRWAGVALPTEAQWEYAARGGLQGARYPWGDHMPAPPPCNIWQGGFPNAPAPGWSPGPAAARGFAPNGHGLYDMAGNVWEWCADWFHPDYHRITSSHEPLQAAETGRRSMRGGSFLCHDSYCNRYRVAARGSNTPESSASNIGFRVVAPCAPQHAS